MADLQMEEKVISLTEGINWIQVVPIFGSDDKDVLYVRIRDEYQETAEQVFDWADRIAAALSFKRRHK